MKRIGLNTQGSPLRLGYGVYGIVTALRKRVDVKITFVRFYSVMSNTLGLPGFGVINKP